MVSFHELVAGITIKEMQSNLTNRAFRKKNEEMVKYMVDERLIKCERDSYETEDKRLKEQRDLPTDKWRYLTIPDLTHMHAVPQVTIIFF